MRPELNIPVSVVRIDQEFFYPLDGMLVHPRVTPSIKFASTHLKGQSHAIWQLYKNLEGVYMYLSIEFQN